MTGPDIPRSRNRAVALTMVGALLMLHSVVLHSEPILDRDAAIVYMWIPVAIRSALWVTCGLVAVVLAWTRWQNLAVVAAVLLPFERCLAHLWAWVMYLVPGLPGGSPASWALAVQWGVWSALIVVLSRWPEVRRDGGR